MKIAVIGSGVTGLAAAHVLGPRHDVTLFEADARPGGHTNTVTVEAPGGRLAIDTGFIVCNPVNYPNFYPFLDSLGVARQDTDMSLGVSVAGGRVEWAGDENLAKVFAQPSLMLSPTHLGMLLAVLRFNKEVKAALVSGQLPDITLGEFLDRGGYPETLKVRYVAAMAGPIWSTSTRGVMGFPFPFFARFFDSHGLLNVYERPQWQTVVGGSRTYVDAVLAAFAGRVHLGTPVHALRRTGAGVVVTTDGGTEVFDAVLSAVPADKALAMLADASASERDVLAPFTTAENRAYLHTDAGLMPRRRAVWSSWNALLTQDTLNDDPIGVSYWMNKLQRLPGSIDYIVSLNPPRPPRPETVLYATTYRHPHYTMASVAAQARLTGIQARDRIAWGGAWSRYGFHEDGFTAGLRAAQALDPGCLPAWATL